MLILGSFLPAVCEYYKDAGQQVLQDAACDGVGESQSVVSQFLPILKTDSVEDSVDETNLYYSNEA